MKNSTLQTLHGLLIAACVTGLVAIGTPALAQDDGDDEYFAYDQPLSEEPGSGGAVWVEGPPEEPVAEAYEGDPVPEAAAPAEGEVDAGYFFDKLAPYGEWMWTPEYGWVWRPHGTWEGWRPYTHGRWTYTRYGWTWVSDFEWGWAPFHYGSWASLDYVGWVWVPGTTWAPAWVIWRYSDEYIGWMPILAGYGWGFGWAYYPVHYPYWTFIGWGHFCDHHPSHYYAHNSRNRDIFRHTYYPRRCRDGAAGTCWRGPASRMVEKRSGSRVELTKVHNVAGTIGAGGPGKQRLGLDKDQLTIYRPAGRTTPGSLQRPATPLRSGNRETIDFGEVRSIPPSPQRESVTQPARGLDPRETGSLDRSTGVRPRPQPGATIQPQRPATRSPFGPASPGVRPQPGTRPERAPATNTRPSYTPGPSRSAPGISPARSPSPAPTRSYSQPPSRSSAPSMRAPSSSSRPSSSSSARPSSSSSSSSSRSSSSSSSKSSSSSSGSKKR